MAASLAEFVGCIMYLATVGLIGYYFGFGFSVKRELRRSRFERRGR